MHDAPTDPRLGPVPPTERIATIDVLRGFAIFGILVVNMMLFAHPLYREVIDVGPWPNPLDRAASFLISLLAEAKFFTLFSFLFGLGLAIQIERAEAKGVPLVPTYLRRLGILLAIGLAHAFLLWWGDILAYYAILGSVLLLFRRARPVRLLRWAAATLLIPIVLNGALAGLVQLAHTTPEGTEQIQQATTQTIAQAETAYDDALAVYGGNDFAAMTAQRIQDWTFGTTGVLLNGMLFVVFAMFLLGLAVGKLRWLHDAAAHAGLLRRVRIWGGLIGLVGTAAYLTLASGSDAFAPSWGYVAGMAGFVIGSPALSMAYAAALALWLQRPGVAARLRPLGAVGRTALSNYLLQSIVCTTIFYGYGLGLYGRVGPAAGLALTIAIFAAQAALSSWWVARFRFGPFEWAWRTLTYGRLQPLRRTG